MKSNPRPFPALVFLCLSAQLVFGDSNLGIFSDQSDVGDVAKPGSVEHNSKTGEYLIAGGGENIWNTNDAFHFVWKKVSGDFTLSANLSFVGTNGAPHRKACLMIRQSLSADSAYVDVAIHGNGLTALQCRDTDGDATHEIQLDVSAPQAVRIEKHGDYISMSFDKFPTNELIFTRSHFLHPAGAMYKLQFKEPFYVGFAVSAHDNKTIEQAVFSNIE